MHGTVSDTFPPLSVQVGLSDDETVQLVLSFPRLGADKGCDGYSLSFPGGFPVTDLLGTSIRALSHNLQGDIEQHQALMWVLTVVRLPFDRWSEHILLHQEVCNNLVLIQANRKVGHLLLYQRQQKHSQPTVRVVIQPLDTKVCYTCAFS